MVRLLHLEVLKNIRKNNDALVLYSKGGIGQAIAEDWETVLNNFVLSLKTIQTFAPTPADVNGLSKKQKKTFIKLFRDLDHDYAHLKSFSTFEPEILDEYGFSQQIYEDYAAVYNNVIEELKRIHQMIQEMNQLEMIMI